MKQSRTQVYNMDVFIPDFICFFIKWEPFVRISNDWATRLQIPYKIWTICNPTFFQPFKICMSMYFRLSLYS